jgi:hypothetical protein
MDSIESQNIPLTEKLSDRPLVTGLSDILRCCVEEFYGIHTSHYPSWVATLTSSPESDHLFSVPFFGWACLCLPSAVRSL